jgi:hypothetical protein
VSESNINIVQNEEIKEIEEIEESVKMAIVADQTNTDFSVSCASKKSKQISEKSIKENFKKSVEFIAPS